MVKIIMNEDNEALEVFGRFKVQHRIHKDLDEPFFGKQGEGHLTLKTIDSKITCTITYGNGQVITHQLDVYHAK